MRRVVGAVVPRGLASDPTIAGGQASLAPPAVTAPLQSVLDLRVPKELKKVNVRSDRNAIEPGRIWEHFARMAQDAQGDPGTIMEAVRSYMQSEGELDIRFLITALAELGSSFDPNSFWATGDKQILTRNMYFKYLIADLIEGKDRIEAGQVPLILYSLSCLEYRPARLMDSLVEKVRENLSQWRLEVLANLGWSLASLNLEDEQIVGEILKEAKTRFADYPEAGSVHDWAQLAFACTLKGLYCPEYGCWSFLANACSRVRTTAQLDRAGWAQFWLYQTLYCVHLEAPPAGQEILKSVPMWIQERLHFRWLDGVLTNAQPQGADLFQLDVDAALKRTNTQARINCSVSRETDQHPCWFGGHKLNPKIVFEYNWGLPTQDGQFRPSGWIELKKRLFARMGFNTVVLNERSWAKLAEQEKDEQIMLLRLQLGYVHDAKLESQRPSQEVPKKRGENVKSLKEGAVKWEDQPDWEPHLREPELEFTVHGYKPKDNPNFKGGVRVNHRRRYIANGNHNWVNSLAPKG